MARYSHLARWLLISLTVALVTISTSAVAWRFHAAVGNVGVGPVLSHDGSFIQGPATGNTGAAAGSLTTVYGTATFGDLYAPIPHYGGGQFYVPLLNGVPVNPSYYFNWVQFFYVGFGGNLFAMLTADQLVAGWTDSAWNGDNGATGPGPFTGFPGFGGAAEVPAGTPTPPALPTPWAGPYTPSSDGTAISGGTGSLTSARGDGGVWTFGASGGGGWVLQRQGITVSTTNSGSLNPYVVTDMQINAQGSLFFKTVDTVWHVWNCWQPNPVATVPTAGPIPVSINFSPPLPHVTVGSADGVFVSNVIVTMSDGSPFAGTLSIGLDFGTGTQLLKSSNTGCGVLGPPCIAVCGSGTMGCTGTYNGSNSPVTVTQNGASLVAKINAQ